MTESRGRHGWRGGRGLQRGQIARLIEPYLLLLLRDANRHGYELISALERSGLQPDLVADTGLAYRALRDMEMVGWVLSRWDAGDSGPPRRVYNLTPAGEVALATWMDELARTHESIHRLQEAFKKL